MGTLTLSDDPDEMQHYGSALFCKIKAIFMDRKTLYLDHST